MSVDKSFGKRKTQPGKDQKISHLRRKNPESRQRRTTNSRLYTTSNGKHSSSDAWRNNASGESKSKNKKSKLFVLPFFNRQNQQKSERRDSSARETNKRRQRYPVSSTAGENPLASSRSANLELETKRRQRRSPKLVNPFIIYGIRLLIIGVGLGVIVGTTLSVFNSGNSSGEQQVAEAADSPSKKEVTLPSLPFKAEILPLRNQVQALVDTNQDLKPGVLIFDLDTGAYLNWDAAGVFAAASTIKVPILIAFFQDVDAGKIRLDEMLTMDESVVAEGSGGMQYQKLGSRYTALETATQMIVTSDNTATNMIIRRLGGIEAVNQKFQQWGLKVTVLRNPLPDIPGTNTTNPQELATLMVMVSQGKLVSMRSRDRILGIMERTQNRSLIPRGLGEGAIIANKTGNIGSLLADVGLIDMPSGKRYVAAIMVQRPRNDTRAKALIRELSRSSYQYFSQPPITPEASATSEGVTP